MATQTATAVEPKTFSFTLTLVTAPVFSVDEIDALHSALHQQGCGVDGSLACRAGTAYLSFDREAPDLGDAISSAVKAVERAGLGVSNIEIG